MEKEKTVTAQIISRNLQKTKHIQMDSEVDSINFKVGQDMFEGKFTFG
jgi:hypothetical protein